MRLTHKTLPLALALLMGALLTAALVGFASVAGRSQRDEALLQQWTRAGTLAAHLDAQFASSLQVVHTLSELASTARTPLEAERLLERTFRSTSRRTVHGLGLFYAPFSMEPGRRYFGPYAYHPPSRPHVLTYQWSTPAYDYPNRPWYQRTVELGGAPFLTEPFEEHGVVYLSITRAFFDERGRIRGVVGLDMTLPQLQQLVADASAGSTDTLYVATKGGALIAHPQAQELLEWARARGQPVRALSDLRLEDLRRYEREHGLERTHHTTARALRQGGWTVYVSTDKATLFREARRLWVAVLLCGGALWGGLLAAAFATRRSLRVDALTRELEAQERAQRTLAASEQKLRQVLHTALDGVIATDAEGRIVEWNAKAEEIFGWRADEALGRDSVQLLLPAWEREEMERERREGLALSPEEFRSVRRELVSQRRNGEEFPVEASTSAVMHEGRPLYYSFFRDVTERHRKDQELQRLLAELRQRTAELHAILDNMVDAVLVADARGRLTLLNPAARTLYGVAADEEAPLTLKMFRAVGLQRPDGRPLELEELPLWRALRGEVVHDALLQVGPTRPGAPPRIIRTSVAPIRDEAGQVVAAVAVSRDVTQAVELERLKDEFLRVAAHELKTPVAVVKSYAQLALKTANALPPAQRRLLEGVGRGADRLDHVVRTLLDASQVHLGTLRFEPREVELRALVNAAAERAAALHPRHFFHVDSEREVRVRGDDERLEQVLLELLDNAARYSPAGSTVEVTLREVDGEVEVRVRDEGVGIPVEQQARLFERFYRPHSGTPHDRGGMGLGLYLAREIARLHGGHLVLESQPGRGTTACVRLPSLPSAHPREEPPSMDAHAPA